MRRYLHTDTHTAAARGEVSSLLFYEVLFPDQVCVRLTIGAWNGHSSVSGVTSAKKLTVRLSRVHYIGERNVPLASKRVTEEHAGYGLEH